MTNIPSKHRSILIFTFILFVLLPVSADPQARPLEVSQTRPLMGTFMEMKAYVPGNNDKSQEDVADIVNDAFIVARHMEQKLSIYDAGSELNVLNMTKGVKVSVELFEVLTLSLNIANVTDGYFDITVAPILKDNGFYSDMPEGILSKIPETYIQEGWKKIKLFSDDKSVTIMGDIWLDLSGIAKGYIVDNMAKYFKEQGLVSYMINAGGDIYCSKKEEDRKWAIGLREPGTEEILLAISISDKAVATSGDYENWIMAEGDIMTHIADPITRKMLPRSLSSVTVISSSCARSDALATAMFAMGEEEAVSLADSLDDVEVIFVTNENGKYVMTYSNGAEEYVTWRK